MKLSAQNRRATLTISHSHTKRDKDTDTSNHLYVISSFLSFLVPGLILAHVFFCLFVFHYCLAYVFFCGGKSFQQFCVAIFTEVKKKTGKFYTLKRCLINVCALGDTLQFKARISTLYCLWLVLCSLLRMYSVVTAVAPLNSNSFSFLCSF